MNSNQTWMTAQTPSAFGMPISGHTFCVSATEARSAVATTLVVRDRKAVIGTKAPSRRTWASPSPTSRGPLPGDHRSVENQQLGSLQAAEPEHRDPRPFCFSAPEPHHPPRSGQKKEVKHDHQ